MLKTICFNCDFISYFYSIGHHILIFWMLHHLCRHCHFWFHSISCMYVTNTTLESWSLATIAMDLKTAKNTKLNELKPFSKWGVKVWGRRRLDSKLTLYVVCGMVNLPVCETSVRKKGFLQLKSRNMAICTRINT